MTRIQEEKCDTMLCKPPFVNVDAAVNELRAGRIIIVVDDEDRENEGDLTMAAEKVTPEAINFMAKYGRGLICLAMTPERVSYLRLGPMSAVNTSQFGTAFTESIDAVGRGVTTGISAYDRAQTVLCAIDPETRPPDLARPGHIFPLRAREGGVLVRGGQTEASVDLARIAGLVPAGVICEVMNEDGTMARVPDLTKFCQRHDLKMVTVAEITRYRLAHERYVHRVGESSLSTGVGDCRAIAYRCDLDSESHLALVFGNIEEYNHPIPVGLHWHCVAGDVFGSIACECGADLRNSLCRISREGVGVIVYLRQDSIGVAVDNGKIGVSENSRFNSNEGHCGFDDQRSRQRDVGIAAQVLSDLGLRRIRLVTNHVDCLSGFEAHGIETVEQTPIPGDGPIQYWVACRPYKELTAGVLSCGQRPRQAGEDLRPHHY